MTIEKNKKMNKGEVTLIERVANEMFLIKIKVAADFTSKPGQFVSILCDNHTMRRPFSIMNFEKGKCDSLMACGQDYGMISVLFKKKGDGTAYIASLNVGDTVDFIGPMGNGFNCFDEKTLLVGAGVGVAPVFYLKKVLGDKARLIAGFQNVNEIPSCLQSELDFISTDDGSLGGAGSIINYLDAQINEYKPERICTCGPHIVLKLVAEKAKEHGIPCEVAMEKTMACSIGVCRGCVVTLNRNGKIDNASVCKDGPVFLGEEIVW